MENIIKSVVAYYNADNNSVDTTTASSSQANTEAAVANMVADNQQAPELKV
jgi:hypothetical protein